MLAPTLDIVTIQVLRRLGCTVSCTPQRLVLNLESDAFLRRSTEIVKAQLEVTRLEVWTGEMVTGPGTMFQIESRYSRRTESSTRFENATNSTSSIHRPLLDTSLRLAQSVPVLRQTAPRS
jgi:hypothetical protein